MAKPQSRTQSCAAHRVGALVYCLCSQDAKILKYPDLEEEGNSLAVSLGVL